MKINKDAKQKLQELNKKKLAESADASISFEEKGYPKPIGLLILFLTLIPLIYSGFVFFVFKSNTDKDIQLLLFIAHFPFTIYMVGLIGFYIRYIFKNRRIDQEKKALWTIIIFFANLFVMPIFWYLYIWKDPEKKQENL